MPNIVLDNTWGKINAELYECHIYLKQTTSETIIGDNTWRSPGTNVVVATPSPVNCSYPSGQIQYNGAVDITRKLYANVSITGLSANTTVMLSGGVNGTPNPDFNPMVVLVNSGDTKLLTVEIPASVQGNGTDKVDFFIRADKDFTLNNANFRFGEKRDG